MSAAIDLMLFSLSRTFTLYLQNERFHSMVLRACQQFEVAHRATFVLTAFDRFGLAQPSTISHLRIVTGCVQPQQTARLNLPLTPDVFRTKVLQSKLKSAVLWTFRMIAWFAMLARAQRCLREKSARLKGPLSEQRQRRASSDSQRVGNRKVSVVSVHDQRLVRLLLRESAHGDVFELLDSRSPRHGKLLKSGAQTKRLNGCTRLMRVLQPIKSE